jgi:hypothetical protein
MAIGLPMTIENSTWSTKGMHMSRELKERSKKSIAVFLLAAAAGIVYLCQTGLASADAYYSRSTSPVFITIGRFAQFQMMFTQLQQDGPCVEGWVLGPSTGLTADWDYYGFSGVDNVTIVSSTTEVCGNIVDPLIYNGHYFDLHGGAGNDRMYSGYGETWMWGEGGDDFLYSLNPTANLSGWEGNDVLITGNGSGTGEVLWAGPGNDCLQDYNSSAATFNCGDGNDGYTGAPVNRVGCETAVAQCVIQ